MKIIVVENNIINSNPSNSEDNFLSFYLKPDSAILRNNQHFYYPEFTKHIDFSLNFVIKINRLGKNIAKEYACRYYKEITAGINFYISQKNNHFFSNDDQIYNIKFFDNSLPIGKLMDKDIVSDINNVNYNLLINEKEIITLNTKFLKFKIDEIVSFVSRYLTIKIGDFILTGIPVEANNLKIGDRIKVLMENNLLLDFYIK